MIRIAVALICVVSVASAASAQDGTGAGLGAAGNPALRPAPSFGASSGTEMLRHRGPTGSPCLDVSGFARRLTVNSNLYDHVVAVTNNCAQRIIMQVCYYDTQDCVPVEVSGGERTEAILGTMPSMKDFRFEFREKF
jgi:hypothetical protein